MAGKTGLVAATFAGALLLNASAHAQQPAKPAAKAAPAKTAQGGNAEGTSWVKLCYPDKTVDEKKQVKQVNVCVTHFERFHPDTGQPLISVGIREIEGQKKPMMVFMVPLNRLLGPGLIMQVDKNEPRKIGYSHCTPLGCIAQAPLDDEVLTLFKKGNSIAVKTIDVAYRKVGFEVSLLGFSEVLKAPPIDPKVYAQHRKALFEQIRKRQIELVKRAQAAKEKKAEQGTQQKAPAQPAKPKKLQ